MAETRSKKTMKEIAIRETDDLIGSRLDEMMQWRQGLDKNLGDITSMLRTMKNQMPSTSNNLPLIREIRMNQRMEQREMRLNQREIDRGMMNGHHPIARPPSPRQDSPRLDTLSPPSPRADPSRLDAPRATTEKPSSPRAVSSRAMQQRELVYRPEPTLLAKHDSPVRSHRESYRLTPTRLNPSPLSQSRNQHQLSLLTPSRPIRTGTTSRYSRGRLRGQDDDSLTSCPSFPSYMASTVSAKAKVRPSSNPKERVMVARPSSVSSEKRRMSYPPTQQQGHHDMFRWNKGSLLISNYKGPGSSSPGSGVVLEKHKTVKSVGNLSIDSTVSMSAASVGRKPFNRYV